MIYSKEDVLNFLPHRAPFLFVDSIKEIKLSENIIAHSASEFKSKQFIGSSVKANFKVGADLEVLRGHFPGNPILPGVVQVEMMAQACPFMFYHAFKNEMSNYSLDIALLGIEAARFKKPIIPEENLEFEGELTSARGSFLTYKTILKNDQGELKAQASILASIKFLKKELS